MTNKEAKEIIKSECYVFNPLDFDKSTKVNTALDMAIKALEKEPCEDCVSREAVKEALRNRTEESISDCINALPSVIHARKKAKWINKSHNNGCGITFNISECTCCGKNTFFDCAELLYRYCPNCGAKMDEDERKLKYADQDTMMLAT